MSRGSENSTQDFPYQQVQPLRVKNITLAEPGRWHNGSAFVFCSCNCTFETEPSPHLCTCMWGSDRLCAGRQEVGKCSTRGESWGMYITFASAKITNKAEPTLALKPRGDITRNPKQGYQWPQKRTCVRQKLFKKTKKTHYTCRMLIRWPPSVVAYISCFLAPSMKFLDPLLKLQNI